MAFHSLVYVEEVHLDLLALARHDVVQIDVELEGEDLVSDQREGEDGEQLQEHDNEHI